MTSSKSPDAPTWITEPIPLVIHAQQVERYGGQHGVGDREALLAAIARPVARWADDAWADLADVAATYLVQLAKCRGFTDGNRRTALACALVFLALNDAPLRVPPAELLALTLSAAAGKADEHVVAAYIRDRLSRPE